MTGTTLSAGVQLLHTNSAHSEHCETRLDPAQPAPDRSPVFLLQAELCDRLAMVRATDSEPGGQGAEIFVDFGEPLHVRHFNTYSSGPHPAGRTHSDFRSVGDQSETGAATHA